MKPYEIYVEIGNLKTYGFNRVAAKQEDKGRKIRATILDQGVPLDLNGRSVYFYANKPDKKEIYNNTVIIDRLGGIVEFELTTQTLAENGIAECELVVTKLNGEKISSALFNIEVIKSINSDTAVESQSEFTLLTQSLANLARWEDMLEVKYDGLEVEYATELTTVKSQLAEKTNDIKLNSLKLSKNIAKSTSNVSDLKTIVTFIDDDGYDGVLDILKPMFTSRGVPYVIALRGDANVLNTPEKRAEIKDLQDNHGWEMASHTMNHIRLNSSTDKEIEDDSISFLNLMHDYGLDVESIVYPWGERGNTSVISKYYRAGFGTIRGIDNDINLDDYNIGREILGNEPSRDTAFFKDMIDSIDGEPRWLVFMTHVSDPATNVQQIEDVVDYVISKNIPIVTASEGLKHYGSLLNSRTNVPSNHTDYKYWRLKPEGVIQTNRYFLNHMGNETGVTGDTLPSELDVGITYTYILNSQQGSLPFGGILVTTKVVATPGYTSQLLYGNVSLAGNEPRIFYRTSLTGSDAWSGWVSLNGINYQTVTEDSPITDFQYGESVRFVTGWSLGNGIVKTIRATNVANYGRQLYFPATTDNIYTRRETSDGWREWKQIQMVV